MIAAAERATVEDKTLKAARRRLVLRDGVTFSVLALIAAALFGVTFFLFRSFDAHRDDLGQRWASRGEHDLAAHRPEDAVFALRAALTYAPDEVEYQMLLAQALADSGHIDEATTYYLNRWESAPGDGFVNLQLARLARQRGEAEKSVEYYRAAIFGDWGASGATKRRLVRMELSDYLIERRDLAAARTELLIGASNAPEGVRSDLLYADRLQAAGDFTDALKYYQKALASDPHQSEALEKAGRVSFAMGKYGRARSFLDRALKYLKPSAREPANAAAAASVRRADSITELARRADRMQQLDLSRELSARERAAHLEAAAQIARARLTGCVLTSGAAARPAAPSANQGPTITSAPEAGQGNLRSRSVAAATPLPADLVALQGRWRLAQSAAVRRALGSDAALQDSMTQLIFDTELITAGACGAAAGDDALLLQMAAAQGGGNAAGSE